MKRCALILTLLLLLFSASAATAQLTVLSGDRHTACRAYPEWQPPIYWNEYFHDIGPYTMDLDRSLGGHHLRSVHESEIYMDASSLTVSGFFLGTLSSEEQGTDTQLAADGRLFTTFLASVPAVVSVEASFPAGGHVFFLDLTSQEINFEHRGPGVFTLDEDLIPGHEYYFQVDHSVVLNSDEDTLAEGDISFSMVVETSPMAVGDMTWGDVKALFR